MNQLMISNLSDANFFLFEIILISTDSKCSHTRIHMINKIKKEKKENRKTSIRININLKELESSLANILLQKILCTDIMCRKFQYYHSNCYHETISLRCNPLLIGREILSMFFSYTNTNLKML